MKKTIITALEAMTIMISTKQKTTRALSSLPRGFTNERLQMKWVEVLIS